jgi:photosystem II stability/assembly factor-like uncharacterized protein
MTKTEEKSIFSNTTIKNFSWRLLGPAQYSGRISDIAVPKGQKHTIYCAAASGGLWKTINSGTTWKPIFDEHGTGSMGAIAISDSDPNIIWVGTGEAIAESHSTWGDGVYKSTDRGKTWAHMGLKDSNQIGRIVIDPQDSNMVYIASVGHLWSSNAERGLFKTTDGGKTWTKSLFISDKVGVVDIAMDPSDRKTLYAAAYGRIRSRYSASEATEVKILEGGGIFKTTDAGATWTRLTEGLPPSRVGKIGLAVALTNPNKIYAILERKPFEVNLVEKEVENLKKLLGTDKKSDPALMKKIQQLFRDSIPASEKAAAIVPGLSSVEQTKLRNLLGLGELDLGSGVFRSADKGKTWNRMNKMAANRSPSYYSEIYVHPKEEDTVYVPLERMWISKDGGNNFEQTNWAYSSWMTSNYIHGDFHAFWVNPEDSNHLIIGTDGGLYSSYDCGENWEAHPMPIGQFYAVAVDMRKPYYIYGGLQDNGGWAGPSATRHMSGITDNDWFKYETADGAYVQVDTKDNLTIYTEIQNGGIKRIDLRTGSYTPIQPRPKKGEPPLRFNFITPFLLSAHDSNTLYIGSQKVLKSIDKGNSWIPLSPDLTRGGKATITTIAESPLVPGLLFIGTEDGNVEISRDDGNTWINMADRFPGLTNDEKVQQNIFVSRIEASHFDPGKAYISFDGHQDDDFRVYLFRTTDYGKTWVSIKGNLPDGFPVKVIREDIKNPNLLFVGTSIGVQVSTDGGEHWVPLKNGLPPVPVADMLIHPRDADLVIGTHGRGIYAMNISPLREMTSEVLNSDIHLFSIEPATLFYLDITKNKGNQGARRFSASNPYIELFDVDASRYILGLGSELAPPGGAIYYYLRTALNDPVEITIFDHSGERVLRRLVGTSEAGVNQVLWDLRESPIPFQREFSGNDEVRLRSRAMRERPGPLVQPGKYLVTLSAGGKQFKQMLTINADEFLRY